MLTKAKNPPVGRLSEKDESQDYSWSGEYSLLLHNIEDNLDSHLPSVSRSPSPTPPSPVSLPSTSQRKRFRYTNEENINEENDSYLHPTPSEGVSIDLNNSSSCSSSSTMNLVTISNTVRLNIQISELKLSLKEITEKHTASQQDHQREKEKFIRQLQFLEQNNLEMKQVLTAREEKYYLMKKKLQVALRTIETYEKEKQQPQQQQQPQRNLNLSISSITSSSSSVPPPPITYSSSATNDSGGYIHELEAKILSKNEEVRYLSLKSSEYEERCGHLEQQLLTLRADLSSTETTSRSISSLQKQQNENEIKLRKQMKEIEKLGNQLKNQQILEQELSSANQKILQLKQSMKGFQEMEAKYSSLVKERESWTLYFKDVIKQISTSSSPGNPASLLTESLSNALEDPASLENISPILILRYMNKLQNKCLELLQNDCQLEHKNSELKSQLLSLEKSLHTEKQTNALEKETIDHLKKRLSVLTQQAILYEGEVMSLRSLLKTYDLEFNVILGNTRQVAGSSGLQIEENRIKNYEKVLKLKEAVISDLRKELDETRGEFKQRLEELTLALMNEGSKSGHVASSHGKDQEGPGDGEKEEGTSHKEEIKKLRSQCQEYQDDIFALQTMSRIDYLPEKTKILRLKRQYNPSYARLHGDGESMELCSGFSEFMTPLEELKSIRKEMKSLHSQMKSTSTPSSSSSGLPSDQDLSISSAVNTNANVVDSNKLNLRLKEMFRERISSYREAVYLLLGYKVDLISADGGGQLYPQLRLKSMYAEDPDDSLVFQWKGGSDVELMETPFAANLDESVLQTLRSSNSIPVFLANISLELFEKQTFLGG